MRTVPKEVRMSLHHSLPTQKYVDLMITCSSGESRGHMTKRSRDNDGNPMVHAKLKLILDWWQSVVEFEEGTEAELTENAIAHSMYAQCDTACNQYLMIDSIIDFFHRTIALCYSNQKSAKNGRTYKHRSAAGW